MVGLLSAARLRCQLIVLTCESWGCLTQLLGLPWGTLACGAGLLLFTASRRWRSRRPEARCRSCAARREAPGARGDAAEPTTPAGDTAGEARPPALQSQSWAAESAPPRLTVQDALGPRAKGRGSQPPTPPKAADGTPTLRASPRDGEQPGQKTLDDWKGDTASPEWAEVLARDMARWRQKLEEEEEEKEGPLPSNPSLALLPSVRAEQDLREGVGRLLSAAETLLHAVPALAPLGRFLDGGSLDVEQKREVGSCQHPVPGSDVALKADLHDADAPVSPQCPERAGSSRDQKPVREELRKQAAALQAEETSVRCEILRLESQLLQLKLQNLLELRQEHTKRLESQIAKAEKSCAEMEEKLTNLCRKWNFEFRILQLHKIAEDMGEELERTRSFDQRGFLLNEERARESWKGGVLTERDLGAPRRGEKPQGAKRRRPPRPRNAGQRPGPPAAFPKGPCTPGAPPAAREGHALSRDPLNPPAPQEGGGVTCRCDSARGSQVLTTYHHGTALQVFLSLN